MSSPQNNVIIGAVGDLGFYRGVADAMSTYGPDWVFDGVRSELSDVDLLFGNLETVLIPGDYPRTDFATNELISPISGPECASALAKAGFNFLNLAANHVLDAGEVGLNYTKAQIEGAGILTGGVGSNQSAARTPIMTDVNGLRIGFLCYCEDNNYTLGTQGPCHAYYSPETVIDDITNLQPLVHVVVVSVHADLEFMPTPSVPRREAFRRFAEAGADLVLGHHPHVPQGCERVGRSLIAYSLGNFVFPAFSSPYMRRNGPDTARSFILKVEVSHDGVESFHRIPVEIEGEQHERPVLLASDRATSYLNHLEYLDTCALDDVEVARNWRNASIAKMAREFRHVVRAKPQEIAFWKRIICRVCGLSAPMKHEVDVERVLNELVGRWWVTAENRAWLNEVLAAGEERWNERSAERTDPLYRPSRYFE